MKHRRWVRNLFVLSGAVNVIGIPVFSKFFTNGYLLSQDPDTFSPVSLFVIILWGLAYIAAADQYDRLPVLSAVFAVEKFFYAAIWGQWILRHQDQLPLLYQQDPITGFFYSVYGLNDFLFGVVFAYACIEGLRRGK